MMNHQNMENWNTAASYNRQATQYMQPVSSGYQVTGSDSSQHRTMNQIFCQKPEEIGQYLGSVFAKRGQSALVLGGGAGVFVSVAVSCFFWEGVHPDARLR